MTTDNSLVVPKLGAKVLVGQLGDAHPCKVFSGRPMYVCEIGMDLQARSSTNVVVTLTESWPPAGNRYRDFLPEELMTAPESLVLRKTLARRLESWIQSWWSALKRRV